MNTVRLRELEGLRGILAWWVVAGHILYVFSDRLGDLSMNGSAVSVFIILSGFVITNLRVKAEEPYAAFIVRRFWRLWPVLLVCLVLSALLLELQRHAYVTNPFPTDRNAHRIALIDTAQAHLGWHMLSHVTMLHGLIPNPLFPDAGLTILGQAWSISIEWQFYLIAPLVIWLLPRGAVGIGGAALIAIGLVALQKYTGLGDNSGFIGRAVGWFAIGIASYFAWMHRDRPNVRWLVALGAVLLVPYGIWRHEPGAIVWAVVMPTICGMLGRPGTAIARFLCWPPIKALGDISYSTYMVHIIVLTGCMALASAMTPDRTTYAILVIAASVPLIWLASLLSYRWLERPGIRTGSELAARISGRPAKSPAQTRPATSDRA